jgi:hypothetical protein
VNDVAEYKQNALFELKQMTSEEIRKGMQAFANQPALNYGTCFVGLAKLREAQKPHIYLSYCYEVSPLAHSEVHQASARRLGDLNAWLKSECIRELAERGVTPEPEVQHEQAVSYASV